MKWIVLPMILMSFNVHAYREYNASRYTCNELKQIVKRDKLALMGGGRFTVHKKYCEMNDKAIDNAHIGARDGWCIPGILCRPKFPNE